MAVKVLMVPDWRSGNPYMQLLSQSIEDSGGQVSFANYPSGYFPLTKLRLSHAKTDVIHLHWLAGLINPILWSRGGWRRYAKLMALVADIVFAKTLRTRFVWTIHNSIEHESINPAAELQTRKVLSRIVDHVIIHSESAFKAIQSEYGSGSIKFNKTSIIRHGHFLDCYQLNPTSAISLRNKLGINKSHTSLLFFGLVRKYKGLDHLLAALKVEARDDLRIIIAGRPFSKEVQQDIEQAAMHDERIRLALEFIPNNEVAAYFDIADAAVIPFERILTSGSAILAMSFGKALILPESAKVLDLPDIDSTHYYDDDLALAKLLGNLDKKQLTLMGAKNRDLVKQFKWQVAGQQTMQCYRHSQNI